MCTGCLHSCLCDEDEPCGHETAADVYAALPDPDPATLALVPLIRRWYRIGDEVTAFFCGGPLHVQLDDNNLEDLFLTQDGLDEAWSWKGFSEHRTPERYALSLEIITLLQSLPEDSPQRDMAVEAAHWNALATLIGADASIRSPYGHD